VAGSPRRAGTHAAGRSRPDADVDRLHRDSISDRLVRFGLVRSGLVRSGLVRSDLLRSDLRRSDLRRSDVVSRFDTGDGLAAAPSATAGPPAPTVTAVGRFRGTYDFHFGSGTASIIEVEPGRYHLRLEDFSVRNGPDLYVYLSPKANGYTRDALELGKLKATDGSFGYDLPPGTDPGTFRSAIIWCKQFSHLFATAPFTDS